MAAKKQRLSISKLAMRFSLHRQTVKARLDEAGINPVEEKEKEKLYELNDDLEEVLLTKTKSIDEVKLRKETAVAEINEIKAKQLSGEMCSVAEFISIVQQIFGNLHKKSCVHLPKTLAKKLKKAKNETEITRILETEYTAVFTDLRENYKNFLDPKLLSE